MNAEMTAELVVDLLQLLEHAGIEVWLDGGWAVDAVLGEQTRSHKDLDIILRVSDLPRLQHTLASAGFCVRDGGTAANFVLADGFGREVDVHAIVFDRAGNGVYRLENGRTGSSLPLDSAAEARFRALALDVSRRRFRCSATLTAMFRRRRTSATWSCCTPASALNCRCTCGVRPDPGRRLARGAQPESNRQTHRRTIENRMPATNRGPKICLLYRASHRGK
jgi:lincosamide nucleotidyltransferase A/C/D/E